MSPRILIIDDDASIRRISGEILAEEGYEIALATNVSEGIAQLHKIKPDLILCDVMMPDGNGYDVLEALQHLDQPMTPFILMSAEAIFPEDIRKGMRSGADDYLVKPFRLQDLLESVRVRLNRQKQFQNLLNVFKSTPGLPPFLHGSEQDLMELLTVAPPSFLVALRLDEHERFQRIFGREGAQLLYHSVFQRLRSLPALKAVDFYASDQAYQIYLCPHTLSALPEAELNHHIQVAFEEPFPYQRYQLHLHSSLGWVYQETPLLPELWLERANLALYQSRLQGGSTSTVFQPQMESKLHESLHWEAELQQALNEKRFELHYQPQFELKTGRIVALEALLRMRHPEFGMIPPGDFIPVAEESGLIVPIGTWVLNEACHMLFRLQELGHTDLRMAVNVSLLQFLTPDFAQIVAQTIAQSGIPAEQLELELTESLLIDNFRQMQTLLTQLKDTGLTLAVDDFGTGYSSLYYLHQLPFDTLKIDQAFVRPLQKSKPNTSAIPRAIVEMAHAMGMTALAEGIENEEQMQILDALGCDFGQGYYISRPLPEPLLYELLRVQLP